jgi:hypothetical protein
MGRRFSYAEVAGGAARVARGLQQRGIGKGHRVGVDPVDAVEQSEPGERRIACLSAAVSAPRGGEPLARFVDQIPRGMEPARLCRFEGVEQRRHVARTLRGQHLDGIPEQPRRNRALGTRVVEQDEGRASRPGNGDGRVVCHVLPVPPTRASPASQAGWIAAAAYLP